MPGQNLRSRHKRKDAHKDDRGKSDPFRLLVDFAPDGIVIHRDGKFLFLNQAAERLFRAKPGELVGSPVLDRVHPDYRQIVRDRIQRLNTDSQVPLIEEKFLRLDGSVVEVEAAAIPSTYQGAQAVQVVIRDISERKRVEKLQDAVYRIAQAPDESPTLDDLYHAFHTIISGVMPASNFYISIYDEEKDLITFPYFVDEVDSPPESKRRGHGLTEYVLRTGRSLLCTLATEEKLRRAGEIELIGAASPIWLGVPLKIDKKTIGVMTVQHYSDPDAYGEAELHVLEIVSSQVARAIERKRAAQEIQRRADEFAALFETARDLSAHTELEMLLPTIVERAIKLLSAASGGMYLYDSVHRDLQFSVASNPSVPLGVRLKLGEGMAGHVALSRQPLIVDDHQSWPFGSPLFEGIPLRAVVQVPMLYGGDLVGVLVVEEATGSGRKFTNQEAQLLSLFAAQAASAVHNARLLQETRARAGQLALLYDAGLALNRVLEPGAQLEFLFKIAIKALRAERAEFFRHDAGTNRIRFEIGVGYAAGTGVEDALRGLDLSEQGDRGLVGWVAKERMPLYLPDLRADPRYISVDPDIRSALWVPVEHENQLLGVLGVLSTRLDAFTPQDERLLVLFANQAAVALENARLFGSAQQELSERKRVEAELKTSLEDTRRRADQLAVLNRIASAISRTLDLDELMQIIYRQVSATLSAESFTIALYDAGADELDFRIRIDRELRLPPQRMTLSSAPLMAHIIRSRESVLIKDMERPGSYPAPRLSGTMQPTRSWLGVPMQLRDYVVGVICVQAYYPEAYGEEERQFLATIADQAGVAVRNARLFRETQERLSDLEAVNKISTAVRMAQTPEEMLPLLLDKTLAAMGTQAGQIAFYDAPTGQLRVAVARGWFAQTPAASPAEDGIAGQVFRGGRPFVTRDFRLDPASSERARPKIPAGWGGAVVPIRAGQEIIGVFDLSVSLPREIQPGEVKLLTTIAEITGNAVHRMRLHESLEEAYLGTVLALAKALDARDAYTNGHSERLTRLALALADCAGMTLEEQEVLRLAAPLHDIGKIGVPDSILRKPAPLSEEEWQVMRRHPAAGADIIQPVRRLRRALPLVRHHHEHFDGSGYPDGLSGEAIPLGARILAVVDAFSAMSDDRVYRKSLPRTAVLEELNRCAGTQFDPRLIEIFVSLEPQLVH